MKSCLVLLCTLGAVAVAVAADSEPGADRKLQAGKPIYGELAAVKRDLNAYKTDRYEPSPSYDVNYGYRPRPYGGRLRHPYPSSWSQEEGYGRRQRRRNEYYRRLYPQRSRSYRRRRYPEIVNRQREYGRRDVDAIYGPRNYVVEQQPLRYVRYRGKPGPLPLKPN